MNVNAPFYSGISIWLERAEVAPYFRQDQLVVDREQCHNYFLIQRSCRVRRCDEDKNAKHKVFIDLLVDSVGGHI